MKFTSKISHPVLDISIYLRENYFIVKIVLHQFEQTYRIKQADVTSMEDVEKMLTKDFLDKVYLRFVDMSKDFKESFLNINKN